MCPITDGTWCKWSNWSKCSVRQGNGIVIRKRLCRHLNNGSLYTSCYGPHTEVGQCYKPDGKNNLFSNVLRSENKRQRQK